eukprot:3933618-Rhodomonas_salina.1
MYGYIDDFRIYSGTLTRPDVQELLRNGGNVVPRAPDSISIHKFGPGEQVRSRRSILSASSCPTAKEVGLVNGDFELGSFDGWTTAGTVYVLVNGNANWNNPNLYDGAYLAVLHNTPPIQAWVQQTVNLAPNVTYELTFRTHNRRTYGTTERMKVLLDGVDLIPNFVVPATSTSYSANFTVGASSDCLELKGVTLQWVNTGAIATGQSTNTNFLDAITLRQVQVPIQYDCACTCPAEYPGAFQDGRDLLLFWGGGQVTGCNAALGTTCPFVEEDSLLYGGFDGLSSIVFSAWEQSDPSRVFQIDQGNAAWASPNSGNGRRFVVLHGGGEWVQQTLSLATGATYELSFVTQNRGGYGTFEYLTVLLDSEEIIPAFLSPNTFTEFSVNFTVPWNSNCSRQTSVTLKFWNTGAGAGGFGTNSVFIDAVALRRMSATGVCNCSCAPGSYGLGTDGADWLGECTPCAAGTYKNVSG